MPELPEVQAVVDGLRHVLPGRRIVSVHVRRADVCRPSGAAVRRLLTGARVTEVFRRAKNIVAPTDAGVVLRVHLGMTGRLLFYPGTSGRPGHTAVTFRLDGGATLVYADVRRFGRVEALEEATWEGRSQALGPEPLDPALGAAEFHRRLATSRTPVRSWLLDPRRVAGVGNIYATEALFGARIHPTRPAASLTRAEAGRLLREVRRALDSGIRAGGTTLRDYRNIDGQEGENARNLRAYGREGSACPRCGAPIERLVFGGRSAFLCPRCQPAPP
ncbi:MAG: bifunctional DNA-formamidopyrimidine glycosylase/DNA-(apurinic or apyrimidinic site) lyase [Gemmatimonadota bacterium]|nr:bifunctional DNA-formamidopyrimidine glycosylase/DNA-(apurinic or apyrimidinic site) lyase [Gemmatimonadota bacterium]